MFKSVGEKNWSKALRVVDCRVTKEMNLELLRTISEAEVQGAVSELGALKALEPNGFP